MELNSDTRVFLTGGSGFVGTHLRAALAEREVPVTLLLREPDGMDTYRTEEVQRGDITEKSSLNLDGHEVVIHLAAQASIESAIENPRRTWEVNADGTLNILEKARAADIDRFLYTSTASIYGPPEYLPIDESHPTNPAEPYGASKLAGDGLTRSYGSSYGLDVVVARIFNAFGPKQPKYNVVPTIVSQAKAGKEVQLGNLTPCRDFIYIDDVVNGLLTVVEQGESASAYNIGRGESVSVGDIAEMAIDITGKDVEVISTSDRQRSEDVEIPRHVADVNKINKLGWKPEYSVREGLHEMINLENNDDT